MAAKKSKPTVVDDVSPNATALSTSTNTGTSTSIPPSSTQDTSEQAGSGKPDKAAYDAEQEKIKTEIAALQNTLVSSSLFLLKDY
jgi:hypothetical protein